MALSPQTEEAYYLVKSARGAVDAANEAYRRIGELQALVREIRQIVRATSLSSNPQDYIEANSKLSKLLEQRTQATPTQSEGG